MDHLPIDIDREVFKFSDPRVDKLRTGGMSSDMFASLVRHSDPFVLIGGTVYALSEQEWYATRATLAVNSMTEEVFQYVLDMKDLSFMHDIDRRFIEELKKNPITCHTCRYAKYRNEVYKLVKKYNIKLPDSMVRMPADVQLDSREYPKTRSKVVPKAFKLLEHVYSVPREARRACIDCVEKHLAQAHILGLECIQGYPEYITLVVGHLCEALDEMPKEMTAMHDTVEFMLARTNYFRTPFVPLWLVEPMLEHARSTLGQSISDQQDMDDRKTAAFDIDITQAVRDELMHLDKQLAIEFMKNCTRISNFALGVRNSEDAAARITWEGAMASTADKIAPAAPLTANMMRNRRLLFVVNPALSVEAGYDMSDVKDVLLERVSAGNDDTV